MLRNKVIASSGNIRYRVPGTDHTMAWPPPLAPASIWRNVPLLYRKVRECGELIWFVYEAYKGEMFEGRNHFHDFRPAYIK